MSVNAKEVQELRKISGAGMMECKSALSEANGDIDKAFKLLREKGVAKAEKKSSRDANEGLIGVMIVNETAAIIEINSETDFVSRNSEFHDLMRNVLDVSIKNFGDVDKTKKDSIDLINNAVSKIGENIVLKRVAYLDGNIFSYVHNSVSDGLGKIGVILSLESEAEDLDEIGKNICMHIAAASPKSIDVDDLDISLVNSEKEIIKQQLKDTGKPENILVKMLDGKMNKFYEENTLIRQKYVINPDQSIRDYLEISSKKIGHEISISKFIRFQIGS